MNTISHMSTAGKKIASSMGEWMLQVATGRFESYQIPINEFEDSHSDHSEDEETDEGWPLSVKQAHTRWDYQISGEQICWRFPGYGKLKLNTDDSSMVARSWKRSAVGIYAGLKIIRGCNLRVVEIESDSKPAIHLIKDETAYKKSPFKELAEKCKAMKQEMGCSRTHPS
ncbi:hypothetical protein C3L33_17013, partial [Rhododendron williamsianum]